MAITLEGNWAVGVAFDLHTLGSTYLGVDEYGHDQWDTTRSEMGELLYQLKYQQRPTVVSDIIALLDQIKGIETLDAIIPVPSSDKTRKFQPVELVASALAHKAGIPFMQDVLAKTDAATQVKNMQDMDSRIETLEQQLLLQNATGLQGLNILLLDDLYRSGATLQVATRLLYAAGCAKVNVLTLTKTRSNR